MNKFRLLPGTVVIADLDPAKGHEQKGKRPCVIIRYFRMFEIAVILPLTTRDKGYFTQVRIPKGEGGLKEDSFALCHQIRALSLERIKKVIGSISSLTLSKIKVTLAQILGI